MPTGALPWYGKVFAERGDAQFTFELNVSDIQTASTTSSQKVMLYVLSETDRTKTKRFRYGTLDASNRMEDVKQFFKDNLIFETEDQKTQLDKLFTQTAEET